MLLLAAFLVTTATVFILRVTFGYLWRPLRPRRAPGTRWSIAWGAVLRALVRMLARRTRRR